MTGEAKPIDSRPIRILTAEDHAILRRDLAPLNGIEALIAIRSEL